MIIKFKYIFKKLNSLNSDIVFLYYCKYRNQNNISHKLPLAYISINKSNINISTCSFLIIKRELPYYYKMLNLYAHFLAILEISDGNNYIMKDLYSDIIYSFINGGENPHKGIINMLALMKNNVNSDLLQSDRIKNINDELQILMNNANKLKRDLKKYGNNEDEFCKNSFLDDYDYTDIQKRMDGYKYPIFFPVISDKIPGTAIKYSIPSNCTEYGKIYY